MTSHLTGIYPHWWIGRRFDCPVRVWACGVTASTNIDIAQELFLGPQSAPGTGFIPPHLIVGKPRPKPGVPGGIGAVWVRHVSGGVSVLQVKSYAEGRESFQGTAQHVILLDEECPMDIYGECLMRTMPTGDFVGGLVMLTFTPLNGLTPVVELFMGEMGE